MAINPPDEVILLHLKKEKKMGSMIFIEVQSGFPQKLTSNGYRLSQNLDLWEMSEISPTCQKYVNISGKRFSS